MSLDGLFDHRAEIWRPTEKRGFGAQVVQTLTSMARPVSGFNCAVVPPAGRTGGLKLQDPGPGELPSGRVDLYLSGALDVQPLDIVRLVAGPEAPSSWRVHSSARPRDHHVEAVVEPWVGDFPEVEA